MVKREQRLVENTAVVVANGGAGGGGVGEG